MEWIFEHSERAQLIDSAQIEASNAATETRP